MGIASKRKLFSLAILGIILPVGLLTTFKLTGILQEPQQPETITLEPISWQIDRPSKTIEFGEKEKIENAFSGNEVSIRMETQVCSYRENSDGTPFYGFDGVEFRFSVNASTRMDTTATFIVKLLPLDNSSSVVTHVMNYMIMHNARVTRINQIGTTTEEAYVAAEDTGSPLYLSVPVYWIFYDQNFEDHKLKVALEFTYQNPSVYKTVEIPIILEIVKDAGETFDTAENIIFGEHLRCLDTIDFIDMFAITAQDGRTLNITVTSHIAANYNLYLYDSNYKLVAESTHPGNTHETIIYTADKAGTYYIKVKVETWPEHPYDGIYTLRIEA